TAGPERRPHPERRAQRAKSVLGEPGRVRGRVIFIDAAAEQAVQTSQRRRGGERSRRAIAEGELSAVPGVLLEIELQQTAEVWRTGEGGQAIGAEEVGVQIELPAARKGGPAPQRRRALWANAVVGQLQRAQCRRARHARQRLHRRIIEPAVLQPELSERLP